MENPLSFVVVGTDHGFQESCPELGAILESLARSRSGMPVGAIAEEYLEGVGADTVAQKLARQLGVPWFSIEMTTQERLDAGILEAQSNRPGMFQQHISCRIPSDDLREEAWVSKLLSRSSGTTIVVCGYLHWAALVMKLRARGHTVDQRVFLETVPQIHQG
jgi:hypothetical protein